MPHVRYINMKGPYGVETVDELDRRDFKIFSQYKLELMEMITNYRQCGMPVYISTRCTKEWSAK
jgi:hypothetical protein